MRPCRGGANDPRWRGRRRHIHRHRAGALGRRRRTPGGGHQSIEHASRPVRSRGRGHPQGRSACRRRAGRHRCRLPRHDGRHQHGDRARRREGRHDHDARLPRHIAHGAPQAAAQFLAAVRPALAVEAAGEEARPPSRNRAHHAADRHGRGAACRRRGERGCRAIRQARHGRGDRCLPVLVPQQRARAARQGDRKVDPARCLRVGLVGRGEHDPRIRALLFSGDERLYRPEDVGLSQKSRRTAAQKRHRGDGPHHAVERRHLDHREFERTADRPLAFRPCRRCDRRPLDR